MYNSAGLIPSRFLVLIAHFIICVNLLWSQTDYQHHCSSLEVTEIQDHPQMKQLTQFELGLSVSVGIICIELFAFLIGLTMFNSTSSLLLLALASHSSASILLSYFVFDGWQCGWYWWIFSIGLIPVLYDFCVVCNVLFKRKY